jgi:hypothetical protein
MDERWLLAALFDRDVERGDSLIEYKRVRLCRKPRAMARRCDWPADS